MKLCGKVSVRSVPESAGVQRGQIMKHVSKTSRGSKGSKMWREFVHAYASLLWNVLSLGSEEKSALPFSDSAIVSHNPIPSLIQSAKCKSNSGGFPEQPTVAHHRCCGSVRLSSNRFTVQSQCPHTSHLNHFTTAGVTRCGLAGTVMMCGCIYSSITTRQDSTVGGGLRSYCNQILNRWYYERFLLDAKLYICHPKKS